MMRAKSKKSKLLKSIEKSAKDMSIDLKSTKEYCPEFFLEGSIHPGDIFEYINGTYIEKAECIGCIKSNGVLSLIVGKILAPRIQNFYVGCVPEVSVSMKSDKSIKVLVYFKPTHFGNFPDELESIIPKPNIKYEPFIEDLYPCQRCGLPRTRAEGGTTFTVCDTCWDKKD